MSTSPPPKYPYLQGSLSLSYDNIIIMWSVVKFTCLIFLEVHSMRKSLQ